jgi:hypothetical protein
MPSRASAPCNAAPVGAEGEPVGKPGINPAGYLLHSGDHNLWGERRFYSLLPVRSRSGFLAVFVFGSTRRPQTPCKFIQQGVENKVEAPYLLRKRLILCGNCGANDRPQPVGAT